MLELHRLVWVLLSLYIVIISFSFSKPTFNQIDADRHKVTWLLVGDIEQLIIPNEIMSDSDS